MAWARARKHVIFTHDLDFGTLLADPYQRTVVGYHGCDAAVAERVLAGKAWLNLSIS
jgi:predicted nuclease of predicted toxin-antitoxin system